MRARRTAAIAMALLVVAVGAAYLFVRGVLASDLVRSTIERQVAAYTGQPVRIRSAGASIYPAVAVTLADVSIGAEPAAIHVDELRVVTGWSGLLERRVTDAHVVVSGGRVVLPLPFPLADPGRVAEGDDGTPALRVESVRAITIRDVRLAAETRTLVVNVEASLEGDRLNVSSLDAAGDRSRIHASGALSSLAKLDGAFDARADALDLDEMIAFGSALARGETAAPRSSGGAVPPRPQPPTPMHLAIRLSAPAGQFGAYALQNLDTTVDLTPGRVALSPLTLETLGGRLRGSLQADTSHTPPRLRLAGRLDGLDVREVMRTTGSEGGLTGRLGGTVSLAGTGTDAASLLGSAEGTITAAVTNGTMPNLDLVREIVLAFGKPSGAPPQGSGSAFSRLGGTFTLSGGTLASGDLAMASRDFDLTGRGSLRLASGAVHARVNVVLSRELTAQAGVDLRRYAQENGRVVVPATIGGTLREPTVFIDVAAATGRALRNELKRRATDFLDKLFKK